MKHYTEYGMLTNILLLRNSVLQITCCRQVAMPANRLNYWFNNALVLIVNNLH